VAEWLALLRYQWWCLNLVGVRGKIRVEMPWAASQNRGDPWNLAGWVTLRYASHRAAEKILYLASNLTNCASGGSPSNTPSRKIWEVKEGLNHGYFF